VGHESVSCYDNWVSRTLPRSFPQAVETVFLDRDGVLNQKMPEDRYVTRWDEFHLLPGAMEAIHLLNQAGIRVIVVSNQRGVALGLYNEEDVQAIHSELQSLLNAHGAHVDGFYFCPHDRGTCNCRKPKPGMFEQAAADFPAISAARSLMIGDSKSDIEFGRRLGMNTAFIGGDPHNQSPGADAAHQLANMRYPSLYEAITDLLSELRDR
jgi:D-glycero-D-manno-heptose 1,7-bisphosphate phosphatase